FFFFQAEDGIRDRNVTGVQTCALPIFIYFPSFIILYTVLRPIEYSSAMSLALSPPWYNVTIFLLVILSILGLPPTRPLFLAACKPACVLSAIKFLSKSANTANMPNIALPVEVVVSILSLRLINSTFSFSILSVISYNCFVDLANLSNL